MGPPLAFQSFDQLSDLFITLLKVVKVSKIYKQLKRSCLFPDAECVGDESGPADDDVDEPEIHVTNGDDLKRKLPGASKTGTAPKKKPKKVKGYVDVL
jgi:hypothetical protein